MLFIRISAFRNSKHNLIDFMIDESLFKKGQKVFALWFTRTDRRILSGRLNGWLALGNYSVLPKDCYLSRDECFQELIKRFQAELTEIQKEVDFFSKEHNTWRRKKIKRCS